MELSQKGIEREKKLSRDVYFSDRYFSSSQLWSFAEQIHLIHSFKSANLIEIGPGNGLVSSFFRSAGMKVKTFDVNPALNPDVVAPVQDLAKHVAPAEYDLISCCEVLEHIPFDQFPAIIAEFSRISRCLLLSLPVCGRHIGFGGRAQFYLRGGLLTGAYFRLPLFKTPLADMHFWELDSQRETRKKAVRDILKSKFQSVESGYFKGNCYHYYFKCRNDILTN